MANTKCLGLYIEEHLIKYAKVSKDHDKLKVESFGIKFYDKLGKAIDQVIQETYSQKTPISINLSEEMYNYFNMFSLLTKTDLQKAIKTEFDALCTDKGYNPNVFESRYAVVQNLEDRQKVRVIHVAENKIELNRRMQQFNDYKLVNVSPISIAIPNLIDTSKKENSIIVNIEDKTTLTTILENKVYDITVLDEGSADFLTKINLKENSYSKSYEICKNTTIYTSEGKELETGDTAYLEDIMPTLYNIVGEVRKTINTAAQKIDKIYITGTAALINNIDLYFQEYLNDYKCEILKPYFISNSSEISLKDYIEVNSAIALATMGLGLGVTGMNFKELSFFEKLPDWLKIDVSPDKTPQEKKKSGGLLTFDLGQKLDRTEVSLIRVAVALFLLVVIYSVFSGLLTSQIKNKTDEAQESIDSTTAQIDLAKADTREISSRIDDYSSIIEKLESANERATDSSKTRNAIPNLLNQIMSIIPEGVQITSIENTTESHIVINAQSDKYEQLGYFKAKLASDQILLNVESTQGQKSGSVVTVTIEGDLP